MVARSRKAWCLLSFVVVFGALRAEAADEAWTACKGQAPDPSIAGCTAVLARGAREITENRATAYYNRGLDYYAKAEHDRAIADFDAALRIDPKYVNAYVGLGLAYDAKGDHDHAIVDYDVVLQIDPKNTIAYNNRGLAHFAKGEHDRAIADYNSVLRIDPENAIAYRNRGLAFAAKGDHDHAISDDDAALRIDPKYVNAYIGRGNAYEAKGDHDHAIADYDAALRIDPKHVNAYIDRGNAYTAKNDHDHAIADYDAALRIDPKSAFAYFNRGLSFEKKGDLHAALADFHKDLDLEPGDAQATAAIGRVERRGSENQKVAPPEVALWPPPPPDVAFWPPPPPEIAPSPPAPHVSPLATPQNRVALVIGNSHYTSVGLLPNPQNDAQEIAKTLQATGFTVTELNDLTREKLVDALAAFAGEAATADWAVIYYSGHGLEMGGVNYLIPVDAKLLTDTAVGFEAIPLTQVMAAVDGAHKLRLIILDACRSNPFASRMHVASASRAPSRGLIRPPEPDPGELIVYAAREGEVASDGNGGNSPFTEALVKEIKTSPVDVRRLFDFVRDDVIEATGGKQHPFTYGSLSGRQDFLFSTKP